MGLAPARHRARALCTLSLYVLSACMFPISNCARGRAVGRRDLANRLVHTAWAEVHGSRASARPANVAPADQHRLGACRATFALHVPNGPHVTATRCQPPSPPPSSCRHACARPAGSRISADWSTNSKLYEYVSGDDVLNGLVTRQFPEVRPRRRQWQGSARTPRVGACAAMLCCK